MEPVKIYVMPISGNFFPIQMGIIAAIDSAYTILRATTPIRAKQQRPDIVLASSGGNVAAYAALASNWQRERMYAMAEFIASDLFIKPWYMYVPTWIFIPFSRSVFGPGFGFTRLFVSLFPPKFLASPQTPEIWTGTFHRATGQQRLFVNRDEGKTLLVPKNETIVQLGSNIPPVYAGDNREILAQATLASASIPWLVRPVTICGEEYSDGGSSFASPLSCTVDSVYDLSLGGRKLRMVYISPTTLYEARDIRDTIAGEIRNLIYSNSVCDMRLFHSIILRLGSNDTITTEANMSPTELAALIGDLESSNRHYALVLFPGQSDVAINVSLSNIIPDQTREVMERVESNVSAFYWTAP